MGVWVVLISLNVMGCADLSVSSENDAQADAWTDRYEQLRTSFTSGGIIKISQTNESRLESFRLHELEDGNHAPLVLDIVLENIDMWMGQFVVNTPKCADMEPFSCRQEIEASTFLEVKAYKFDLDALNDGELTQVFIPPGACTQLRDCALEDYIAAFTDQRLPESKTKTKVSSIRSSEGSGFVDVGVPFKEVTLSEGLNKNSLYRIVVNTGKSSTFEFSINENDEEMYQ